MPSVVNNKIPKVLEIINFSLKLYIGQKHFTDLILVSSKFEKYIFHLLTDSPFNNVLHNHVKKLLLLIIDKGSPQLIDLYFGKNSEFYLFLEFFIQKKHKLQVQNKWIKLGFVGQTVAIITALKHKKTEGMQELVESKLNRRHLGRILGLLFQD